MSINMINDFVNNFLRNNSVCNMFEYWIQENNQLALEQLISKNEKTKKISSPSKRSKSAYIFYCSIERILVKKDYPEMSTKEISIEIERRWQIVKDDIEQEYEELYKENMIKYISLPDSNKLDSKQKEFVIQESRKDSLRVKGDLLIIEDLIHKGKKTISQYDLYEQKQSHKYIKDIVMMNNKKFGHFCEDLVRIKFNLQKSNCLSYDAMFSDIPIEIKSSRYWVGLKTWKWQHIMLEHNYKYILLVGIDYNRLRYFIISKEKYKNLYNAKIIKQQGNAEGQGTWCSFFIIKSHVTEISNVYEIEKYFEKEKKNKINYHPNLDINIEIKDNLTKLTTKIESTKKTKKNTDPTKPKRGKSAYIFFCTVERAQVKEDYPEMSPKEITSELGRRWQEIKDDKEARADYDEQAQVDKERYQEEMKKDILYTQRKQIN